MFKGLFKTTGRKGVLRLPIFLFLNHSIIVDLILQVYSTSSYKDFTIKIVLMKIFFDDEVNLLWNEQSFDFFICPNYFSRL